MKNDGTTISWKQILIKKGIRKKYTLIDTIPSSEVTITNIKNTIKTAQERYSEIIVRA